MHLLTNECIIFSGIRKCDVSVFKNTFNVHTAKNVTIGEKVDESTTYKVKKFLFIAK